MDVMKQLMLHKQSVKLAYLNTNFHKIKQNAFFAKFWVLDVKDVELVMISMNQLSVLLVLKDSDLLILKAMIEYVFHALKVIVLIKLVNVDNVQTLTQTIG